MKISLVFREILYRRKIFLLQLENRKQRKTSAKLGHAMSFGIHLIVVDARPPGELRTYIVKDESRSTASHRHSLQILSVGFFNATRFGLGARGEHTSCDWNAPPQSDHTSSPSSPKAPSPNAKAKHPVRSQVSGTFSGSSINPLSTPSPLRRCPTATAQSTPLIGTEDAFSRATEDALNTAAVRDGLGFALKVTVSPGYSWV
jgi:hypothetical protein